MSLLLFGMAALMSTQNTGSTDKQASVSAIAPAAKTQAPPSPTKLILIRRFLRAIGRQDQLDTGSFLEHYAIPGGPMWHVDPGSQIIENLSDGFRLRMSALNKVYAKHRFEYQQAYESHVNWEFTEDELSEIVAFLERPVGKHYLDGRWRMEAYTGTNTEELEERIVTEAQAYLSR